MNGLDLFSGIGGLSLALKDYVRPLAYCEIDPYCQTVLLSRQLDGLLPKAPIWDDITTLRVRGNGDNIHIIYGGFPCQDISIAGLGKGLGGERSGLVYEIFRLSRQIRPSFIFLENVPAITTRGGVALVKEIAEMGYDCRWCVISAASLGAPHKRDRWFMLAHSRRFQKGREKEPEWTSNNPPGFSGDWKNKPPIHRMDDGVPNWMDRNKSLGNAVVPAQAKEAFKILMGIK